MILAFLNSLYPGQLSHVIGPMFESAAKSGVRAKSAGELARWKHLCCLERCSERLNCCSGSC